MPEININITTAETINLELTASKELLLLEKCKSCIDNPSRWKSYEITFMSIPNKSSTCSIYCATSSDSCLLLLTIKLYV